MHRPERARKQKAAVQAFKTSAGKTQAADNYMAQLAAAKAAKAMQ